MFYSLVICIYAYNVLSCSILLVNFEDISNFKTYHNAVSLHGRHHYLIFILININSRSKIVIEKRLTLSFMIFNVLTNKTQFILEVRCNLN